MVEQQGNPQGEDVQQEHNFVVGWVAPEKQGNYLVKEFELNENRTVKLKYMITKDNKPYYNVEVYTDKKEQLDYIRLAQLPTDMTYMAYFLQESIKIDYEPVQMKDTIGLKMLDVDAFEKDMQTLERTKLGAEHADATL